MSEKPVIVYGASGYTERLICEYLREYGIPFVAAGRSEERLAESLDKNVAGVETAESGARPNLPLHTGQGPWVGTVRHHGASDALSARCRDP